MRPLTLIALSSLFAFSPLSLVVAAEAIQAHADAQPEATSTWPIRMLSASEAQADVALMRRSLETIHPGLYRRASRNQMDQAFGRLEERVKRPIETAELYRLISLVLAEIRCNHTKAEQPPELEAWRQDHPSHLPFRFQIVAGKMIVVAVDPDQTGLVVGSEIMRINGRTVQFLTTTLGAYVPLDGQTIWSRATSLANDSDLMGSDFDHFYPYVFGPAAEFNIQYKAPGETKVALAWQRPLSFKAWQTLNWPGPAFRSNFSETTSWRPLNQETAYLKVSTFVNYRKPVDAHAFYDKIFSGINASGAQHLIVDLRYNGGGSGDATYALADFLAQKPYVWNKAISYKVVRYGNLPNHIDTWGDRDAIFNPPLTDFTKAPEGFQETPSTSPDELLPRVPAANRFKGRVTVLTSPVNASGSTMLIAKLRDLGRVSLVGGKSGGSGDGPTAGRIFNVKLPNSGIQIRVPNAFNQMQVKEFERQGGVTPDLLIEPSVADVRLGRDPVLATAVAALPTIKPVKPSLTQPALLSRLTGTWTGTLEYRDYQSDGRVKLPTLMRGDLAPDGQSVKLRFTYDDGPGKTLYGGFVLAFDAQEAIASKTEEEGSPDLYRVIGDLAAKGPEPITLVLWGRGTENGEAVDARETLTVSATSYELLRETRIKGKGEFQFRHVYRFTRDSSPK
ncbi:MAG: hypothetical protein CFE44_05465 [Burkholderiales bacterium PBB4]|nr:MAG: hypothetical protein CFE44_05465 [Burkholderiales bacterium PBB4]